MDAKIRMFESLGRHDRINFLTNSNNNSTWGGPREEVNVVTNDTLDCLLSLVLDFPTMSAYHYMCYLNSKYGQNYKTNISLRTVYTCLDKLNLTLKKASFAPPNRNSVGLRIFRVAWTKFMKTIIKDDNILLGFVDEAAVTSNIGIKYGRAFAGITPVINCPLKKKMSFLSIVFPGFGILYKFVNKAVNGKDYSQFLSEVIEFARKYICNNQTEILIIEDNCPMHAAKCVEEQIPKLCISLIPIVPYSPSLNGVVEGYFGFVKLKNILTAGSKGEVAQRIEIEKNWKAITNIKFTLEIAQKLYKEWISRMDQCEKGFPLAQGHIKTRSDINISKFTQIAVNRLSQN